MKAIVFATYISKVEDLWIGEKFLKLFNDYYSDYTIFIGNNSPCDEWINLLNKSTDNLNIYYKNTDKNLEIDSDASAFETALSIVKKYKDSYDFFIFMHTKSVTSGCYDFLDEVTNNFLIKKDYIEEQFLDGSIGSVFPYLGISDKEWINNCLNTILPETEHSNTGLTSLYTFYAIKGVIIKWFLDNVDSYFFELKITDYIFMYKGHAQNFDRYFFERDFPMIYEKLGYKNKYLKKCY